MSAWLHPLVDQDRTSPKRFCSRESLYPFYLKCFILLIKYTTKI